MSDVREAQAGSRTSAALLPMSVGQMEGRSTGRLLVPNHRAQATVMPRNVPGSRQTIYKDLRSCTYRIKNNRDHAFCIPVEMWQLAKEDFSSLKNVISKTHASGLPWWPSG